MNIQVNFIKPTERRSASIVSVKLCVMLVVLVVPLVIAFFIVQSSFRYADRKNTLTFLESQQSETQRQKASAEALRKQYDETKRLYDQVVWWGHSRIEWDDALSGLQNVVPPMVQIRSFQVRLTEGPGAGGAMMRGHRLTMAGYAQGPGAEEQVELFRRALEVDGVMSTYVERAVVSSFREDDRAGAAPVDRLFQIDAHFIRRGLKP